MTKFFHFNNGRLIIRIEDISGMVVKEDYPTDSFWVLFKSGKQLRLTSEEYSKLGQLLIDSEDK